MIGGALATGLAAVPVSHAATPPTGINYPYGFAVTGQGSATYQGSAPGTDQNGNPCTKSYTEQVTWKLTNVFAVAERPIAEFTHGNFSISNLEGGATNPLNHRPESTNLTVTLSESGSCPPDPNAASYGNVCGTSTSTLNQFTFALGPAPVQLFGYGNFTGSGQCPYDPFAGIDDSNAPAAPGVGPCTGAPCEVSFGYVSGPADSAVRGLDQYCTASLSSCTFPRMITIGGSTTRSYCQGPFSGSAAGNTSNCTPPEQQGGGETWQDTSDSWQLTITATPENAGPGLRACVVPRLRGKRLAQAIRALRRANCSLGRVSYRRSSGPRLSVIQSNPRAGTRHPPYKPVALVVSI